MNDTLLCRGSHRGRLVPLDPGRSCALSPTISRRGHFLSVMDTETESWDILASNMAFSVDADLLLLVVGGNHKLNIAIGRSRCYWSLLPPARREYYYPRCPQRSSLQLATTLPVANRPAALPSSLLHRCRLFKFKGRVNGRLGSQYALFVSCAK
jgi:hypothetical protein